MKNVARLNDIFFIECKNLFKQASDRKQDYNSRVLWFRKSIEETQVKDTQNYKVMDWKYGRDLRKKPNT